MPERILAILGGADLGPELLKKWGQTAQFLIAADGGADRLLHVGIRPNVIVGDLDSISRQARSCGAELVDLSQDQATTDCDKLLAYALDKSLLPLTLICFEGDRLDQVLGALHSVAKENIRNDVRLVTRRSLAWVLGPGEHSRIFAGKRAVSLVPLTPCEGVDAIGLLWKPQPKLAPGEATSISNVSENGSFSVALRSGLLLLTVGFSPEEMPVW